MQPPNTALQVLTPLVGSALKGEKGDAIIACNDYLRMPARSLRRLIAQYEEKTTQGDGVPTVRLSTLEHWCKSYAWVLRASAYDQEREAEKSAIAAHVLRTGYANVHERVGLLDTLTRRLMDEMNDGALFLRRTKGIGYGEQYERIEERMYNHPLVDNIRGLLKDLAEETGGRTKRIAVEVTGLAGLLSKAPEWNAPATDVDWEEEEEEEY